MRYLILRTIRSGDTFYPPGIIVPLAEVPEANLQILVERGIIKPLEEPAEQDLVEVIEHDADDRRYQRQRRKDHAGKPGH